MASNTPFRLYKVTTFRGGHQVPLIVAWPRGLAARGEIRSQYGYVTDVLPTLVDLIGLDVPGQRRGAPAQPMTGTSLAPTLRDASAPTAHPEQYLEVRGHRAYYRDGWEIVTLHYGGTPFGDGEWQLYDVERDPTQTQNLADEEPSRVEELARAFDEAAWANDAYPVADLGTGLHAMRDPADVDPTGPVTLDPDGHTLDPNLAKALVHGRSFSVTVRLDFSPGDRGILVAHGDQGGGYSLYVDGDRLYHAHNAHGSLELVDGGPLEPGAREIELRLTAAGGQRWDAVLAVDGVERAAREGLAMLSYIAPFEGIDVGIDRRSPVAWDVYEREGPFPYTGTIRSVTYTPGEYAPDATQPRAARLREEALLRYE
jgi:arylsulfatase